MLLMLWSYNGNAQQVERMKFQALEPIWKGNSDTVYVVNFWATWCKPCVDELPHFLDVARAYRHQKVKFVLVSLDFPRQFETRLMPFVAQRQITERVILLDETNANLFVNRVDPMWSGAIPATLFYCNGKRVFVEASLSKEELEQHVQAFLKP